MLSAEWSKCLWNAYTECRPLVSTMATIDCCRDNSLLIHVTKHQLSFDCTITLRYVGLSSSDISTSEWYRQPLVTSKLLQLETQTHGKIISMIITVDNPQRYQWQQHRRQYSPAEERRRMQGRTQVVQPNRCPAEWMHQSCEMDSGQQESVKSTEEWSC